MRVVILSHGYAPALNARAFRWTALAEHWASQGHDVDVITVRTPGTADSTSKDGVRIHRVGIYMDRLALAARQTGHATAGSDEGSGPSALRKFAGRSLVRGAKVLHDLTWKKIYWPDYAVGWIPFAAMRARSILRDHPDAVLVSVSMPFSGHVAALLALAGRRRVRWVADIGDPFSFSTDTPTNNTAIYSRLNFVFDRLVIRKADSVTVTTDQTREHYAERFGHADKIVVIPPLMSAELPQDTPRAPARPFRLVYIGTLNRKIRNPDRLLLVFSEIVRQGLMDELELHFYGETGDCKEVFEQMPPDVGARIKVHGLVSRERALAEARQSLAILNIGNATSFQLPSKLVEYAAVGRPIINFVTRADDSSEKFLTGVPGVLTLNEQGEPAGIAARIVDFLGSYLTDAPPRTPPEWFERFSLEYIGRAYEYAIAGRTLNATPEEKRKLN